ncbi:hypothetical protein SYNPS1DRAFT_29808 [Syncephalis pseudoplumigaleata]|uniref:Uncharacterized protein n=1 Tax=Syncephalis pseudoplumigaleata TaxID=1712513 RepID=A0A4P9YWX0_9FUNG|nr:hypothetical protein SYNPS1DRAFT_29808 [Syncephalis pseudoplumigaleata]|eukprot:RKP24434.1 hypothetical protein SYNPS1DRAFT_29808 [Syncephalis pseudoplumigaleata]
MRMVGACWSISPPSDGDAVATLRDSSSARSATAATKPAASCVALPRACTQVAASDMFTTLQREQEEARRAPTGQTHSLAIRHEHALDVGIFRAAVYCVQS